jgi:hypothetical protein
MRWAFSKTFGRQVVNEVSKRFNIKGVLQMGDGSSCGIVSDNAPALIKYAGVTFLCLSLRLATNCITCTKCNIYCCSLHSNHPITAHYITGVVNIVKYIKYMKLVIGVIEV